MTHDIDADHARRAARVLDHQHYPDVAAYIRQELIDDD